MTHAGHEHLWTRLEILSSYKLQWRNIHRCATFKSRATQYVLMTSLNLDTKHITQPYNNVIVLPKNKKPAFVWVNSCILWVTRFSSWAHDDACWFRVEIICSSLWPGWSDVMAKKHILLATARTNNQIHLDNAHVRGGSQQSSDSLHNQWVQCSPSLTVITKLCLFTNGQCAEWRNVVSPVF